MNFISKTFRDNLFVNCNHNLQCIRNATKKAGGSTRNGRDSPGQRLGVKKFGGYTLVLTT